MNDKPTSIEETFSNIKFQPGNPLDRVIGLNDCPFCGGKEGEAVIVGYLDPRYIVSCANCQVRLFDDRLDKVKGKWNTRNGFCNWNNSPTQSQSIEGIVGFVLEYLTGCNVEADRVEELKSDIIKEYNNGK